MRISKNDSFWQDILCGLKEHIPNLFIMFGILSVVIQCSFSLFALENTTDVILEETISAVTDADSAIHIGMMFERTENCYFKAVDDSTMNNVYGSDEYPMFTTNRREIVIDGTRYFYAMNYSKIYAFGIILIIACIASVVLIVLHVNRVIQYNVNKHDAWMDMTDDMVPKQLIDFHAELMKHNVKKWFNYKLVFGLPLAVFALCIVFILSNISDVGVIVTDGISGVIQHHGAIHSEKVLEDFDRMDDITVEILEADPYRVPPLVAGGGFHIDNRVAKTYKTLLSGDVLCVSYDLNPYYRALTGVYCMLISYFIYISILIRKNDDVNIVD